MLTEILIGGVAIGGVYSLLALGFSMIMRATGIIHFAQGEVMMLGSMCGLTALWLAPVLPLPAVLLMGMAAGAGAAALMALLAYRTLRRRRVPLMNIITATVGVSILAINGARLVWGSEPLRYPDLFGSGPVEIGAARVSPQLVWIAVSGFAIMLALQLFLKRTRARGSPCRPSRRTPTPRSSWASTSRAPWRSPSRSPGRWRARRA
jgi:branched-subunit amino acid ABC-type transport system permease component